VWATTIAWGRNRESGEDSTFVLAETNLTLNDRDSWFGRLEAGTKTAHDLDIHGVDEAFTIAKAQVGYVRFIDTGSVLKPGIGVTASIGILPRELQDVYGGRTPLGFGVFFTVRPAGMAMTGTDPHAGHQMP
jgi:hypothetical protein